MTFSKGIGGLYDDERPFVTLSYANGKTFDNTFLFDGTDVVRNECEKSRADKTQ